MALITKTEVYVANAGDTRAVIAASGKAKNLSNDHKPDDINEKRRIQRGGGFVEEGRVNGVIAISRAIGDWEYKNTTFKPEDNMVTAYPEVIVESLRPDHDFLIIACDGIWDCMTSQEAVSYIYEQKNKFRVRSSTFKEAAGSTSPTKSTGTSSNGAAGRKSVASPTKKTGILTHGKTSGGGSPGVKGSNNIGSLPGLGISRIIEMMFDKICPMNLATSEGIGTDNMTCVVIEFNK